MIRISKWDLIRLQAALITDAAIGKRLGISRQAVFNKRVMYGIKKTKKKNQKYAKEPKIDIVMPNPIKRRCEEVKIFDYTDFRKYLGDYYAAMKKKDTKFGYGEIAKRAGFRNKGFAYNLFYGKRHISPANCQRISRALYHIKSETKYFKLLVAFNQEKRPVEKNLLFKKLIFTHEFGKGFTEKQILLQKLFEINSHLYIGFILNQIERFSIPEDIAWILKKAALKLTPGQAMRGIELLENLGLIKKEKGGVFKKTNKKIEVDREIEEVFNHEFHQISADFLSRNNYPVCQNGLSMPDSIVSVSKESLKEICSEMEKCKTRILEIAHKTEKDAAAYLVNINIVPMMRNRTPG